MADDVGEIKTSNVCSKGLVMVEYSQSSFYFRFSASEHLKDFTLNLWKKRGTLKTIKICSSNIHLRVAVYIYLREVRFIAPRLYRMCCTGTIVRIESLFASIKTYNLAGAFLIVDLSFISFITNS